MPLFVWLETTPLLKFSQVVFVVLAFLATALSCVDGDRLKIGVIHHSESSCRSPETGWVCVDKTPFFLRRGWRVLDPPVGFDSPSVLSIEWFQAINLLPIWETKQTVVGWIIWSTVVYHGLDCRLWALWDSSVPWAISRRVHTIAYCRRHFLNTWILSISIGARYSRSSSRTRLSAWDVKHAACSLALATVWEILILYHCTTHSEWTQ